VIVRRAGPNDERALYDLVLYAQRRVLQVEWNELRASLKASVHGRTRNREDSAQRFDLLCGTVKDRVVCLWASIIGAEDIAHLRAMIVDDNWPMRATAAEWISGVRSALRSSGSPQIAYVGLEPWLIQLLAENGFVLSDSVVTYQKVDETIPDRGNPDVRLRAVQASDLDAVWALDRRAFVPLWQTDAPTLAGQLAHSPYFVLAQRRQAPVGYACTSLTGRHGHLTRLVVDPGAQGQGIGVRLLAACVGFFQQKGVYGITLNTQKDNLRARRLYEWFGFRLLGQEAEVWLCTI
jgi:ribosomal protein S18 acetylase RimI-like enzyme